MHYNYSIQSNNNKSNHVRTRLNESDNPVYYPISVLRNSVIRSSHFDSHKIGRVNIWVSMNHHCMLKEVLVLLFSAFCSFSVVTGSKFKFSSSSSSSSSSMEKNYNDISSVLSALRLTSSNTIDYMLNIKETLCTIQQLLEQTLSPTIKQLGTFLFETNIEMHERRWLAGHCWKSSLKEVKKQLSKTQMQLHKTQKQLSSVFIPTTFERVEIALREDGKKGLIQDSDYEFLVIGGFSDMAIELLCQSGLKHKPPVTNLADLAWRSRDLSFHRALLECTAKPEGFSEVVKRVEFWCQIMILGGLQLFLRYKNYLRKEGEQLLVQRLRKIAETGILVGSMVIHNRLLASHEDPFNL